MDSESPKKSCFEEYEFIRRVGKGSYGDVLLCRHILQKREVLDIPYHYSREIAILIQKMLRQNPDQRPTAKKILTNAFIQKRIVDFLETTKHIVHSSMVSDIKNISTEFSPEQTLKKSICDVSEMVGNKLGIENADEDRTHSKNLSTKYLKDIGYPDSIDKKDLLYSLRDFTNSSNAEFVNNSSKKTENIADNEVTDQIPQVKTICFVSSDDDAEQCTKIKETSVNTILQGLHKKVYENSANIDDKHYFQMMSARERRRARRKHLATAPEVHTVIPTASERIHLQLALNSFNQQPLKNSTALLDDGIDFKQSTSIQSL